MTREEALSELSKPIYPPELLKKDREFLTRKFELSNKEFTDILEAPAVPHSAYPSNAFIFKQNKFGLREIAKKIATRV